MVSKKRTHLQALQCSDPRSIGNKIKFDDLDFKFSKEHNYISGDEDEHPLH